MALQISPMVTIGFEANAFFENRLSPILKKINDLVYRTEFLLQFLPSRYPKDVVKVYQAEIDSLQKDISKGWYRIEEIQLSYQFALAMGRSEGKELAEPAIGKIVQNMALANDGLIPILENMHQIMKTYDAIPSFDKLLQDAKQRAAEKMQE